MVHTIICHERLGVNRQTSLVVSFVSSSTLRVVMLFFIEESVDSSEICILWSGTCPHASPASVRQ